MRNGIRYDAYRIAVPHCGAGIFIRPVKRNFSGGKLQEGGRREGEKQDGTAGRERVAALSRDNRWCLPPR